MRYETIGRWFHFYQIDVITTAIKKTNGSWFVFRYFDFKLNFNKHGTPFIIIIANLRIIDGYGEDLLQ